MGLEFGGGEDTMHIRSWTPEKEEIYQLKKRLERPADTKKDILDKIKFWKEIQTELYDIKAVKYTDMPNGTDTGKPTEEKVMLIQRLQNNIEQLESELKVLENEIQEFDNLTACLNPIQKNILSLRYIKHYTWNKMSTEINYTERQCRNIHLASLKIIINSTK